MYPLKQSTAITVPFFAHDANGDGVTGLVDGGFTKRISKNGGAFGAMTVTITEMENGWYSFPLDTGHSDTLGILSISLSHASIKRANLQFRVHARLPDDHAFPATSGRSMVVDAAGLVDANTVKLGPTGAGTAQTARDLGANVDIVLSTGIQARLPAALVGGRMDSSVGAMAANVLTAAAINADAITAAKIADGSIDAATFAAGAINAAAIAADAITAAKVADGTIDAATIVAGALNGKGDWNIGKTGYALSAAGVQAIWDALTAALTTVGSIGKLLADKVPNLDAAVTTRAAPGDAMDLVANAVDAAALAADAVDEIIDEPIEGAETMRQQLRIFRSFVAGKGTGGGTVSINLRDAADTKNRIAYTVDAATGDRSAVTVDGT